MEEGRRALAVLQHGVVPTRVALAPNDGGMGAHYAVLGFADVPPSEVSPIPGVHNSA